MAAYRGVFRTLSNIYKGAFFVKILNIVCEKAKGRDGIVNSASVYVEAAVQRVL